jgi:hypothetical protein
VFRHFQQPLASEWFIGNEQVGAALFLVAVVFPRNLSRLGWLRRILVLDEILAHLIHADPRDCRVIRLTIHIDHILHVIDKVPVRLFGEAPRLFEPGLQLVFFSVVLTVSGLMCST